MPMLNETSVDTLFWYRPERIKERFELRRDQVVVATLNFDRRPPLAWEYTARHPASAETANGTWKLTVVRRGFLGLKADVHVEGTNTGVLEAGYLLRKGTLRTSEMLDHVWVGSVIENSGDVFNDLQGSPVMRLDRGDYFERVNARVAVLSPTAHARDVTLLASVGLYMRLLMNKVYR